MIFFFLKCRYKVFLLKNSAVIVVKAPYNFKLLEKSNRYIIKAETDKYRSVEWCYQLQKKQRDNV